MPTLPSGKQFAVSRDCIKDLGANWFNCPEGHFWYETPDCAINPPPYKKGTEILSDFKHAPVPESREEVKRYIKVLFLFDEGKQFYWRGDWLTDFPKPGDLNEEDLAAWNEWLDTPDISQFLDETIEVCRQKAEKAKQSVGSATFHSKPGRRIK